VDPRLLDYYNTELAYLREAGAEFAAEFPKIAARLDLRGFEVADPYVERLLEGMAFLSARVQLKMDAEFPRFAQRLLEVIYPNYLAPTPSICVVQFTPGEMPGGAGASFTLPRGQRLRAAAANETRTGCEFRTAHEVELWPLTLETARLEGAPGGQSFGASARRARAALRLVFQLAAPLSGGAEPPDRLPLYLNASPDLATRLYELVCGHGIELQLRCTGKAQGAWQTLRTPGAGVFGIGFDESESLLPYSSRGFQGYRLLHEYFACPARFNFIELRGLRAALRECEGLKSFEVRLLLDRDAADLEAQVDANRLALYCTPAVNLIEKRADRILVDDSRFELHLVADRAAPLDFEVHSVQSVEGFGRDNAIEAQFRPFYRSLAGDRGNHGAYFSLRREPRRVSDSILRHGARSSYIGSETFLSLVDQNEAPFASRLRQLGVSMTVTNRDLPLLMSTGGTRDFVPTDTLPVAAVRILHGPTRPAPAVPEGSINWRLISQLSLGHSTLVGLDEGDGALALRELLSLYAALGEPAVARHAASPLRSRLQPITRRLPGAGPLTYGRGVGVSVEVDEGLFAGSSAYVFGAVLQRFLARHVGMNSFTEMRLHSAQRGEIACWQPQIGLRPVA
jgi:type VI secretion system protein ImpG